jgi:hypothetical protein
MDGPRIAFHASTLISSCLGSVYDSCSRARDVASKTGQLSRIRRADHGSRRYMASLYQAGTVEPANFLTEPGGQRYPIFHSLLAFLQVSVNRCGWNRTTGRDARPRECCGSHPARSMLPRGSHVCAASPRSSGAPSGGWMRPVSGRGVQTATLKSVARSFVLVYLLLLICAFTSAHTMGQYI